MVSDRQVSFMNRLVGCLLVVAVPDEPLLLFAVILGTQMANSCIIEAGKENNSRSFEHNLNDNSSKPDADHATSTMGWPRSWLNDLCPRHGPHVLPTNFVPRQEKGSQDTKAFSTKVLSAFTVLSFKQTARSGHYKTAALHPRVSKYARNEPLNPAHGLNHLDQTDPPAPLPAGHILKGSRPHNSGNRLVECLPE